MYCQASSSQFTEVHFASFLSGGFITAMHSSKSTGKETGKTQLCALRRPKATILIILDV